MPTSKTSKGFAYYDRVRRSLGCLSRTDSRFFSKHQLVAAIGAIDKNFGGILAKRQGEALFCADGTENIVKSAVKGEIMRLSAATFVRTVTGDPAEEAEATEQLSWLLSAETEKLVRKMTMRF